MGGEKDSLRVTNGGDGHTSRCHGATEPLPK